MYDKVETQIGRLYWLSCKAAVLESNVLTLPNPLQVILNTSLPKTSLMAIANKSLI